MIGGPNKEGCYGRFGSWCAHAHGSGVGATNEIKSERGALAPGSTCELVARRCRGGSGGACSRGGVAGGADVGDRRRGFHGDAGRSGVHPAADRDRRVPRGEHHVGDRSARRAIGPGPDQIASPLLPLGLRTVDGTCNNLIPGQETFGAADQPFPRLMTPVFRSLSFRRRGSVRSFRRRTRRPQECLRPPARVVSNLIVDQTSANPAAVAAVSSRSGRRATRVLFHVRSSRRRRVATTVLPTVVFRRTRRWTSRT